MSIIDRYLKIAKNAVIETQKSDIEEKIIKRLENLSEEDKRLLDKEYLDYIKKNNSKAYLFSEELKNNPGNMVMLGMVIFIILGLIALVIKKFSIDPKKVKK